MSFFLITIGFNYRRFPGTWRFKLGKRILSRLIHHSYAIVRWKFPATINYLKGLRLISSSCKSSTGQMFANRNYSKWICGKVYATVNVSRTLFAFQRLMVVDLTTPMRDAFGGNPRCCWWRYDFKISTKNSEPNAKNGWYLRPLSDRCGARTKKLRDHNQEMVDSQTQRKRHNVLVTIRRLPIASMSLNWSHTAAVAGCRRNQSMSGSQGELLR